jgi:VanZ family protein
MLSLKSKSAQGLAGLLLAVLAIILVAGLWPFDPFPANDVTWLKSGKGLNFVRNSLLLSRSPLDLADPQWSSISLELWLQPAGSWQSKAILSIYSPENPRQLSLVQYHNLLILTKNRRDTNGRLVDSTIGVEKAVYPDTPVLVTITGGPQAASIYLNGKLARTFPGYTLNGSDLSGQLIFGTSPFERQSWHGEMRGLAIYGAELGPADVLAHYEKWMNSRQQALAKELVPTTFYDFHEGTGATIHDLNSASPDLLIPKYYFVPHKPMLQWPWKEYRFSRSYALDVAINICGFIPLGFLLSAFLWSTSRIARPVLTTIFIGALVSFTIEFLQAFIPERSSGMTDIITNTLGTAIGAIFFVQHGVIAVFTRIGFHRPK